MLILFHHIIQFCPESINIPALGHLAVAMFFLRSGYGVSDQVKNNEVYLRGFLSKHILKIYVPYLIVTIIYIIVRAGFGIKYTVENILLSLIGYKTIVNFSWYIFAQLVLYITFWTAFRLFRDKNRRLICLLTEVAILILASMIIRLPSYCYVSLMAFPIGASVSAYQTQIQNMTKNNAFYFSLLTIFISLCAICYFGYFSGWCAADFEAHIIISIVQRLETAVCDISFVGILVLICCRCCLHSVVMSKLAIVSYEVYLFQGLFVKLFAETLVLNSNFSYFAAVIFFTLLLSTAIHTPMKKLSGICEEVRVKILKIA